MSRTPRVSVNIANAASQVITVDGAVAQPGMYPLVGRMSLMRAVARASGTTEFARENHVVVFRDSGGKKYAALYDLAAISTGNVRRSRDILSRLDCRWRLAGSAHFQGCAVRLVADHDPHHLPSALIVRIGNECHAIRTRWPSALPPESLPFEESIDRAEDDGTFRISQFAKLLGIARKRKWALAGMITAMLLLSLVLTMLATPYYTATAVIEIQRETRNFTNVEGAEADKDSTVDQEFYQTQYGLLQARSLADRVSIGLGLQDDAHFFALFGSKRAGQWFEGGRLKSDAAPRTQRIREAGDLLLENLRINPQRLSRLVEVKFSSPDPAFSKRIVDAWGTQFIQGTLERRFDTTSYARKFLEDRLGQLRTRIDEAERQLVTYAAREGIVNLPSVAADNGNDRNGERSLVAEDLVTLNRELLKATADRVLAQSRLGAAGGNTNEALANQGISDMRGARAQLAAQYAQDVAAVRTRLSARSGAPVPARAARPVDRSRGSASPQYAAGNLSCEPSARAAADWPGRSIEGGGARSAAPQHPVQHLPARRRYQPATL
ncbi:MAG: Wzz/FepE/Etk N-terminal domain-containing protein [Sphingomonas sp.]